MSHEITVNDMKIIPTVFHLFLKQYKLKNLAMNNTLMAYLDKRLHPKDSRYPSDNTQPGPVICISREVGCGAVNITNCWLLNLINNLRSKNGKY